MEFGKEIICCVNLIGNVSESSVMKKECKQGITELCT